MGCHASKKSKSTSFAVPVLGGKIVMVAQTPKLTGLRNLECSLEASTKIKASYPVFDPSLRKHVWVPGLTGIGIIVLSIN
jgi:hypothetical protein